ncbi:MAG: hypothetical protein KGZ62_11190 [Sulfurimonas sp.]|jgi:hypothetical protein|nr:hypothetical protein [Sulfurimonas sp.]MDX9757013.1 hypothetical protein [Sulfurimonas sp.]
MTVIEIENNLNALVANFDKVAKFYDPNKIPEGLRKAHHTLDMAINATELNHLRTMKKGLNTFLRCMKR